MSSLIKTSLIIPAWNAENTIKECLLSALKAESSPDEIIVVDDLSSDKTRDIVKNLKLKYRNIKLLQLENRGGPANARDKGAKKAEGDIIFFTDSDVVLLNNTFANAISTFKKYNADAVSGIYSSIPLNKGKTQLYKALFFNYHFMRHKNPFEYETFNGQIAAIKKSVYNISGGYNSKIKWGVDNENEEFGRRIKKKFKLYLDPNFQVKHHFPDFRKLTQTYFFRVSTYMYIFLENFKFESKGGAAADVGFSTFSVFLFCMALIGGIIFNDYLYYVALFFFMIWLFLIYNFFLFVYKLKGSFIFYALLLNLWFSNIISLGAIWGGIKWIQGRRD